MPAPLAAVTIARRPTSGVTARGGDAFANTLLRRAGFVYESALRESWYRLHFDIGEEFENERATHAYEMLTAARYPVSIDPSLLVAQAPVASAQSSVVAALTARISQAEGVVEVTEVLDELVMGWDGVLPELQQLTNTAGEWCERRLGTAGLGPAMKFRRFSQQLGEVADDLSWLGDELIDVGSSLPPATQDGISRAATASSPARTGGARARSTGRAGEPGFHQLPLEGPKQPPPRSR